MPSALFEEYTQWEPLAKIELINGQLVIYKSLVHSRLLLNQILRGWGAEAAVALAPEALWWQALHQTFQAPTVSNLTALECSTLQAWADQIDAEPELPGLLSHWNWKRSEIRDRLYMACFGLGLRDEKLGRAIGGSFVNRLGSDALMPDILFFRGQSSNCLYQYYLDGAAELVVEFVTPGCEEHDRQLKRSCYQAAGVPELWLVDTASEDIELLRLIDGVYQRQYPDATGRYAVSTLPGVTFIPANLWSLEAFVYPPETNLFEIAADASTVGRIRSTSAGIDWNHAPARFPISLEPTTIAFEDYLYWVPEPKFEFVEGKPDIGGSEGIRGLTGMLLMTLGLSEAVTLLHPRSWVEVLLRTQTAAEHDPGRKAEWWELAHRAAALLREQFGATRIAMAGDLISAAPLNFWSELFVITWDLPGEGNTGLEVYRSLRNLSNAVKIYWFEANDALSPLEQRVIDAGLIEI